MLKVRSLRNIMQKIYFILTLSFLSFFGHAQTTEVNVRQATAQEKKELENKLKMRDLTEGEAGQILYFVEYTIKTFKDKVNSDFGLNKKSVVKLSEILDEEGASYSDKAKSVFPTVFGAYLGQAMISEYGGKWQKSGDNDFVIHLNSGQYAFPALRVYKHIVNGNEDSILALYESIPMMQQQLQTTQPNK